MPDDIDGQIDALLTGWARETQEREAREAEALRERLEKRKAALLARTWKPYCCCRACLRAILTMDPVLACQHSCQWWK
jgi:hypothetical protein